MSWQGVPLDTIQDLLDQDYCLSAEILISFILPTLSSPEDAVPFLLSSAESAFHRCNYALSATLCEHSVAILDRLPEPPSPGSALYGPCGSDVGVRILWARALHVQAKHATALRVLEGIAPDARTPRALGWLARTLDALGKRERAIQAYRAVLAHTPLAVEAGVRLAALGAAPPEGETQHPCVAQLIRCLADLHRSHPARAASEAEALASSHCPADPSHGLCTAWLTALHGACRYGAGDHIRALGCFSAAREANPHLWHFAGVHALALRESGEQDKLLRAAQSLPPETAAGQIMAGAACELRGTPALAVDLLSKANNNTRTTSTVCNGIGAPVLLGHALRAMQRPADALQAYKSALRQAPALEAYEGICEAHLTLGDLSSSAATARQALDVFGKDNARALTLLAKTLSRCRDGEPQAMRLLRAARLADPTSVAAAVETTRLSIRHGNPQAALECLETQLAHRPSCAIHTEIGAVHCALQSWELALMHYQIALSMNPDDEAAQRGIERIERRLAGHEDPEDDEDERERVRAGGSDSALSARDNNNVLATPLSEGSDPLDEEEEESPGVRTPRGDATETPAFPP